MKLKKKETSPIEKTARVVAAPGYDSVLSDMVELLDAARRASAHRQRDHDGYLLRDGAQNRGA